MENIFNLDEFSNKEDNSETPEETKNNSQPNNKEIFLSSISPESDLVPYKQNSYQGQISIFNNNGINDISSNPINLSPLKMSKNFSDDMKLVGKVSLGELTSLYEINEKIDVVIDFSNPANLDMIIDYCTKNHTPVVIATTGYSDEQKAKIKELSKLVPVLWS